MQKNKTTIKIKQAGPLISQQIAEEQGAPLTESGVIDSILGARIASG